MKLIQNRVQWRTFWSEVLNLRFLLPETVSQSVYQWVSQSISLSVT